MKATEYVQFKKFSIYLSSIFILHKYSEQSKKKFLFCGLFEQIYTVITAIVRLLLTDEIFSTTTINELTDSRLLYICLLNFSTIPYIF